MDALPQIDLADFMLEPYFTASVVGDPERGSRHRQVMGACYSFVEPEAVVAPRLVIAAPDVAASLGLSEADCARPAFAQIFGGCALPRGAEPYALCYGGHQFGQWAGQLGDGRVINLGERRDLAGRQQTIQLKGAGPTPYSRSADGRAVLRSSLREFLCSEAMHHLGVPSTRALSLITSGEQILRDVLYNGHPALEPGAVVCRVAPSFLRFGSYEILAARGDEATLRSLLDFTIISYFPELGVPNSATYVELFHEICRRTADLMVHWNRVGFVHGVMNTDNMSILGLTMDYGPYGWLEPYDPDWTPNTTDARHGRYRFGRQGEVAAWNLSKLAQALHPLINDLAALQGGLEAYYQRFDGGMDKMLAAKLGFAQFNGAEDRALYARLLELFALCETDMTIFFRRLALVDCAVEASDAAAFTVLREAFYAEDAALQQYTAGFEAWLQAYRARCRQETASPAARRLALEAVNPAYVLRNYLVQLALDRAAEGDEGLIHELYLVLRNPYKTQPGMEHLAQRRPEWARTRVGCSMLSCSS